MRMPKQRGDIRDSLDLEHFVGLSVARSNAFAIHCTIFLFLQEWIPYLSETGISIQSILSMAFRKSKYWQRDKLLRKCSQYTQLIFGKVFKLLGLPRMKTSREW